MAEEKEKEETEKKIEEKEEAPPIWKKMPPGVVIGVGILIFLLIRGMEIGGTNKNFIYILIGLGILYILSQKKTPREKMITPREAELLTERELERKSRPEWSQFSLMSKYRVGPVLDMMHRDARGRYYNVAVEIIDPYTKPKYYTAKVMADGPERGFTTLIESIGPLDGRKIHQEKDWASMPDWLRKGEKYPFLQKLWLRE